MANSITVDELQVLVTANTKQLQKSFDAISGQLEDVQGSTSKFSKKSAALFGVVAGAAQVLVDKGINLVSDSIGTAIKRIDTLNNAPKVLQNLGFTAQDSAKAIKDLDLGMRGLPTRLDDAATALVSIASASGLGIEKATKLTLAFNDMALAGGKGPEEAQRALLQYTQALGRGKFQVEDFNTLLEVMPAQLNQVAKTLLGPTANAQKLRDALTNGKVSVSDFNDAIIELDDKGGKGFASFHKQAKDATKGIGTSISNMQAAVIRGVSDIIKAIGSGGISDAIGKVGTAFEDMMKKIAGFITKAKEFGKTIVDSLKSNQGDIASTGSKLGTALGDALIDGLKKIFDLGQILLQKLGSIDWASLGIQAGKFAIPFLLGFAMSFINNAIPQAFEFIKNNWEGVLLALLTFMFAPAKWVGKIGELLAKIPFAGKILSWIVVSINNIGVFVKSKAMELVKEFFNAFLKQLGLGDSVIVKPFIQFLKKIPASIVDAAETVYIKALYMMDRLGGAIGTGLNKSVVGPINRIKTYIVDFFSGAGSWLYNAGKSIVGGLVSGISAVLSRARSIGSSIAGNIKGGLASGIKGIESIIKGPLNFVIGKINGLIGHINSISGKVHGPKLPAIPYLAKGGIIDQATLAMVGENGREAVMPLENNTGWIDELAGKLNSKAGAGGPITIINQLDGKEISRTVIKDINQFTFLNGTSPLNI